MAEGTPANTPVRQGILGSRFEPITVVDGVHIIATQGNSLVVETAEGVVFVDSHNAGTAAEGMIEDLRKVSNLPVRGMVYSHGHVGYNSGLQEWKAHWESRGDAEPIRVGHRNVKIRYERYTETRPFQNYMNIFQFPKSTNMDKISPMFEPNTYFDDVFEFADAERPVTVFWTPSETDDCTCVWLPKQKILYSGPAAISGFPNIGTPQRIIRDTRRWIQSLNKMIDLNAEILVPEFGQLVHGADEVRERLVLTRDALQWLVDETMVRINKGMTDVEIIHDIEFPEWLTGKPYLQPNYGAPEYVIRDLFREQSGWWVTRNPTDLHPLHPDEAAQAVLDVVDARRVIGAATALIASGEHQKAMHVLDLVALAPGNDPVVQEARNLKADCCDVLSKNTTIYVSKNMFRSSAALLRRGLRRWSEAMAQ